MTKEELEKEAEVCMHNALYWLKLPISKENVEQGGSYILKLLEPREKQIAELEHQLTHRNCLDCSNHSSKLRMRTLELEKENAELKKLKRECETSLCRAEYQYNYEQLTKAKDKLKRIKNIFYNGETNDRRLVQIGDIINEVEKCGQ